MVIADSIRLVKSIMQSYTPRVLSIRWQTAVGIGRTQWHTSQGSATRSHASGRHVDAYTTVIVVGSTTTALLIEALAEAGMLQAGSNDSPTQHPDIVRTAEWSRAERICQRLAPCMVIHDSTVSSPRRLVDRGGQEVRVVEAHSILEAARYERGGGAPHRTGNDRKRFSVLPGGRPVRKRSRRGARP